ncbi:hypothetical protein SNE40_010302 [Patella caerulea]|uniref:Alpha/beta hydrolase fold-3 domain-containing protein n=1 Tax=Patella caerulea TaxID=87958 RepID=A0AAN8K0R1_PATCE
MPEGLEEFFSKYKLHEESVSYLRETGPGIQGHGSSFSVDEVRASAIDSSKKYGGEVEFEGSVKEFKVPSFSTSEGVPVTVIKSRTCKPRTPIVVYFHGGGFVAGSRETEEPITKQLAREGECIFVNVEYRLAPENKFPAPFDDAKCVLRWVIMNKSLIGGMNDSKVGVLGVGVGGTIAATVCQEVPSIAFQILVYPLLDLRFGQPSCQEFSDGPLTAKKFLEWGTTLFLNDNTESENQRASPLLRPSFTKVPPLLVILADVDPLKDQGYEYKRILKDSGIDAESLLVRGSVHGFFTFPGNI